MAVVALGAGNQALKPRPIAILAHPPSPSRLLASRSDCQRVGNGGSFPSNLGYIAKESSECIFSAHAFPGAGCIMAYIMRPLAAVFRSRLFVSSCPCPVVASSVTLLWSSSRFFFDSLCICTKGSSCAGRLTPQCLLPRGHVHRHGILGHPLPMPPSFGTPQSIWRCICPSLKLGHASPSNTSCKEPVLSLSRICSRD